MHISQLVFSLTLAATAVTAGPVAMDRRAAFSLKNGQDAQALNRKFQTLTADSPCTAGENGCVNGQFAQCVGGKFQLTPCAASEKCFAVPLVNKAGTRYARTRTCPWGTATLVAGPAPPPHFD